MTHLTLGADAGATILIVTRRGIMCSALKDSEVQVKLRTDGNMSALRMREFRKLAATCSIKKLLCTKKGRHIPVLGSSGSAKGGRKNQLARWARDSRRELT